jgi:hypothetical protein
MFLKSAIESGASSSEITRLRAGRFATIAMGVSALTAVLTGCGDKAPIANETGAPAPVETTIEEPATPAPVETQVPENTLTDEQLLEISAACFDEAVADPELTNVIAAMPEEWAQSTYDMAQNGYCETVVVNVDEWRKMSRFEDQ